MRLPSVRGPLLPLSLLFLALAAAGCTTAANTVSTSAGNQSAGGSGAGVAPGAGGSAGTTNPAESTTGAGGGTGRGRLSAEERCAAVQASVLDAGFGAKVSVDCDASFAYVRSDTYPEHPKMNGIRGTNDQVPVPAPGYASPVTLSPRKADRPTSIDAALGVAVNGVPIYDYSSQGGLDLGAYDPKFDTKLTGELDLCNGHAGRGDDYHYHASPTCMIAAMANAGPEAILGWAFDGYPIFGDEDPDGSPIEEGRLDVCNGQEDATYGYRYHTSAGPPYILQCLSGEFDLANAPRVRPLSKLGGGGGRPPGAKPPGGVTNLQYVDGDDGTRTMTYEHQGQTYSIAYRASDTENCWDFSEKSYSTKGVFQEGTYCRSDR